MIVGSREAPPATPETVLIDFQRRFRRFPRSNERVDPNNHSLVDGFGLPPPPPRDAPKALLRMWKKIFGKPVFMLEFNVTADRVQPSPIRILPRRPQPVSNSGLAEDSQNWSGAYVTANRSTHLGTMFGVWRVPEPVTRGQGAPQDYSCSTWIGFDGQRRYFDSTLPQIGTLVSFLPNGERCDVAWVQWWEPGSANFLILHLPVGPGNTIGAFMHVVDPTHVWFVIVNLSTALGQAFTVQVPEDAGAFPVVFGATAEWVVERPTHPNTTTLYELPNFVSCRMCGLALQTAQIGAPLYQGDLRDLSYARTIRMYEQRTDPPRTAIIAMPHRAGPTAVNVTFGGF